MIHFLLIIDVIIAVRDSYYDFQNQCDCQELSLSTNKTM